MIQLPPPYLYVHEEKTSKGTSACFYLKQLNRRSIIKSYILTSLQLHPNPVMVMRGCHTQGQQPEEFPCLSVEFPYLIEEDIVPFFHSYLPRNKEQQDAEERTLRLLLLKTTTCPLALINPTCRYYFAHTGRVAGCGQAVGSQQDAARLGKRFPGGVGNVIKSSGM